MVVVQVVVGVCQVTHRRIVRNAPGLRDGLACLSLIFLNNLFPVSPGGRDFAGVSISPGFASVRYEASREYWVDRGLVRNVSSWPDPSDCPVTC